jgi:hypothetical protein
VQVAGARLKPGNTKGGSITVPLTSCLTGLDKSVLQLKTKIVSCHTADSKQVKKEVNGTVILPALVFPAQTLDPWDEEESVLPLCFIHEMNIFPLSLTQCQQQQLDCNP